MLISKREMFNVEISGMQDAIFTLTQLKHFIVRATLYFYHFETFSIQ